MDFVGAIKFSKKLVKSYERSKTPLFCRDLERKNEGRNILQGVVWGGWRDKKRRKRGEKEEAIEG